MEDQVDQESLIIQLRTAFLQQNLGGWVYGQMMNNNKWLAHDISVI